MKKIAILPTLVTLGNAICGFAAIVLAGRIESTSSEAVLHQLFFGAGVCILVGMVFDALDGAVARLARATSDFGGQLDSLCDGITFGAAPAFLLYQMARIDWGEASFFPLLVVIAGLYGVCTILRLARFNVENTDPLANKRFKGLPSPAAAGCIAVLVILRSNMSSWTGLDGGIVLSFVKLWAPLGGLFVALLMVSRLPYPHLTKQLLRGGHRFHVLVQVVLIISVIAVVPDLALFVLFWLYAMITPIRYGLARLFRRGKLQEPEFNR